jgi:hypothetical protein
MFKRNFLTRLYIYLWAFLRTSSSLWNFQRLTKRDIIFRRMQLKELQRQGVHRIWIQAHILSVMRKLTALLEYQGIVENAASISFLRHFQKTLTLNVP